VSAVPFQYVGNGVTVLRVFMYRYGQQIWFSSSYVIADSSPCPKARPVISARPARNRKRVPRVRSRASSSPATRRQSACLRDMRLACSQKERY